MSDIELNPGVADHLSEIEQEICAASSAALDIEVVVPRIAAFRRRGEKYGHEDPLDALKQALFRISAHVHRLRWESMCEATSLAEANAELEKARSA